MWHKNPVDTIISLFKTIYDLECLPMFFCYFRRQKVAEQRSIEDEANKRIEEMVAKRVEEELERRREEIEAEVMRRVEEAKKTMEAEMLKELERRKQEQLEEARKREVRKKSRLKTSEKFHHHGWEEWKKDKIFFLWLSC